MMSEVEIEEKINNPKSIVRCTQGPSVGEKPWGAHKDHCRKWSNKASGIRLTTPHVR